MTSVSLPASGTSGTRAMAGIEARRLARHPAFLLGVVLAFGLIVLLFVAEIDPAMADMLSIPVIPAFFIGLPSLVATARLTRSAETAEEAMGTAPGSEARRTKALLVACLVPFTAGLGFVGVMLVMAASRGVHPAAWWFPTLPDWQVWSILIALGPVACFGGAVLGVLVGRWLRFPGAAAVVVIALVAVDMVGQLGAAGARSELRLGVPWAMFHSGTEDDGTATQYAGNPAFYLCYLLCLCAAAALVAVWHDRATRTNRLRNAIVGVTVAGLACLALSMTTGPDDNRKSEPISSRVSP